MIEGINMNSKENSIRKSGTRDLIPIFQERLEGLENHLAVITYVT